MKRNLIITLQDSNSESLKTLETLETLMLQILPLATGLPLIRAFHEKNISIEGILRMNRNHFIRFGLDKESADILFNSLRSFGESTSEGALISEARTIRRLKSLTTVAIIGTAGRDNTGTMTMNLWMKMCERAQDIILNEFQLHQHQVELISGGAACADHVAVYLFLHQNFSNLKIYFPCKWVSTPHPAHEDTGKSDWRVNPGKTANRYHQKFSKIVQFDSLREIEEAKQQGAVIVEGSKGFHERNSSVAQSKYLIAFTWSTGSEPKDGGTKDTWNKCSSPHKVHVPLADLCSVLVRR